MQLNEDTSAQREDADSNKLSKQQILQK